MVSEFRRKKYMEVFNSFDRDSSGTIEKKDFEIAAEEIAKANGKVDEGKRKEYLSTLLKIWEGIASQADSNKDGHVSAEEWVALWDAYAKNPSAAQEWQSVYCKFTFQLLDTGGDGTIDSGEFVKAYEAWGFKRNGAEALFEKMSGGKPAISWAEFQVLWKEYFAADDVNAPGNSLFTSPPS
ncbi:unnamed protein product, partial [Iphiclides podalirius]